MPPRASPSPPQGGTTSGPAKPVPRWSLEKARPDMQLPLILQQLFRRRIVMGATIALVLVVLVSVFAGALSGFGPNETAVSQRLSRPSAEHLLGTDELGRDLFTRIAFGGR